jgi:hypothetical protein
MAYTALKNSQLDVVGNSQITYTSWFKTYYFQLTHMRYGQNAGYTNNYSSTNFHDNYYYNTSLTKSFTNVTEDSDQQNTHSVEVASANGFTISDAPAASSTLTDNFVPFDSAGTIYQNQTSKSLDQAIALLGADCATCTSSYIQGCINDYNTNSASKNVYNNLTSGQTYNGTTTEMSAFAKMKAFADRYGLNVNAASGSSAFQVANNSHQPEATIFVVMASAALLAAGAYVALKRKDA